MCFGTRTSDSTQNKHPHRQVLRSGILHRHMRKLAVHTHVYNVYIYIWYMCVYICIVYIHTYIYIYVLYLFFSGGIIRSWGKAPFKGWLGRIRAFDMCCGVVWALRTRLNHLMRTVLTDSNISGGLVGKNFPKILTKRLQGAEWWQSCVSRLCSWLLLGCFLAVVVSCVLKVGLERVNTMASHYCYRCYTNTRTTKINNNETNKHTHTHNQATPENKTTVFTSIPGLWSDDSIQSDAQPYWSFRLFRLLSRIFESCTFHQLFLVSLRFPPVQKNHKTISDMIHSMPSL